MNPNETIPQSEGRQLNIMLDMHPGQSVTMVTRSGTEYKIEKREDGVYVSGSPQHCPEPMKVVGMGAGKTGIGWESWVIKEGQGVVIQFEEMMPDNPTIHKQIDTSPIKEIRY